MYELFVDNINTRIHPALPEIVVKALDNTLSFKTEGYYYSTLYRKHHWDGRTKLFRTNTQSFSTGLISRVLDVLDHFSVEYAFVDRREQPVWGDPYPLSIQARDYQDFTVDEMIKYERGIIKVGTGGGKSVILTKFLSIVNVPTLILVPRVSLLKQLHVDLSRFLNTEVGWVGEGTYQPRKITVSTIQSMLAAYGETTGSEETEDKREMIRQVVENVSTIVVDESQHMQSTTLKFLSKKAEKAYYRFGMSATPFYGLESDMIAEMFTGRKIVDIGASELIKRGWLSKPTIYFYNVVHPKLPKMTYGDLYTQEVVQSEERNGIIKRLTLEHTSRGSSVLIAVTRIEHGRILEGLLKPFLGDKVLFVDGSFVSEELFDVLGRLDRKELECVIATTVFGEGVNVPSLNVLVNAKGQSSKVDVLQLAGRALRKTATKNTATIIDFQDSNCRYLDDHSRDRKRVYKEEPEFEVVCVD